MSSLIQEFIPDVDAPPFYSSIFHDSFQMGSFVHLIQPSQDPKTTTVVRLLKWIPHGIKVQIFYPLFPKEKLRCHPNPPKHNKIPLPTAQGRNNIELYMSNEVMELINPREDGLPLRLREIFYPAFVFSLTDLDSPANRWAYGVENVFVVRYKQHSERGLVPIPENCLRFMVSHDTTRSHLICPPRSCHLNIWTGLFLIRKAISKMLNRRSGQAEEKETNALTIGHIPVETYNYISLLLSRAHRSRCVHKPFKASETYLDITNRFTRRKSRIQFESGVIRFATKADLDKLRTIMGFGSTYGSTEIRPTLYHGDKGLSLKRGHSLTIIAGGPVPEEPVPFKKRTKEQRIELSFSQFSCRVTVSFQRYLYDTSRAGVIKVPPPTTHLELTLKGQLPLLNHAPQVNDNAPQDNENLPSPVPKRRVPEYIQVGLITPTGSPRASPQPSLRDSPERTTEDVVPEHSSAIDPSDLSIIQGEQFHLEDTVWEVLDIFSPKDVSRTVLLEVNTGDLYTTRKPEPPGGFDFPDDEIRMLGTIPASETYHIAIGACAGEEYDDRKPHCQQKTKILELTDEVHEAIRNYR